ncbi:MAG: hypothetical protein R3E93_12320 [Thiothrix sp.]
MPANVAEGSRRHDQVEFFNSPANLKNLAEENGLFRTRRPADVYRKLVGHSVEFDTSIILDTSQRIADPLGRPVRRDQISLAEKENLVEDDPDPVRLHV